MLDKSVELLASYARDFWRATARLGLGIPEIPLSVFERRQTPFGAVPFCFTSNKRQKDNSLDRIREQQCAGHRAGRLGCDRDRVDHAGGVGAPKSRRN